MSASSRVDLSEVYERYGRAMYFAQVLEALLVDGLLLTGQLSKRVGPEDLSSYVDALSSETLGKLLARLAAEARLPKSLSQLLNEARILRNHLAHSYLHQALQNRQKPKLLQHEVRYLLAAEETLRSATTELHGLTETYRQAVDARQALKVQGKGGLAKAKGLLKDHRRRQDPMELAEDYERFEDECEYCGARYIVTIEYSATRADAFLGNAVQFAWIDCPNPDCRNAFELGFRATDRVEVEVEPVDERWVEYDE